MNRVALHPPLRWTVPVLLAACALLRAEPAPEGAADNPIELGRKIFTERCASCHFVPDRAIERDRVWLGLIPTTA